MVNKNVLKSALQELDLSDLQKVGPNGPAKNVPTRVIPAEKKGFQRDTVAIDGNEGHIDIVREEVPSSQEEWKGILEFVLPKGVNADDFVIDDSKPVRISAWNQYSALDGERTLYAIRAYILRKSPEGLGSIDINEAVRKAKTPKVIETTTSERVAYVQITDLQTGQSDGNGAEAMVKRALTIPAHLEAYIKSMKKAGKPVTKIFVPITGDLVEGVIGFYGNQEFSVTLDRRDQVKVARRLIQEVLLRIAQFGLPVHVAVVPGNHGQNRNANGGHGSFTSLNDNDDVALVEQIADGFDLSPEKFGHVTFSFPAAERLSLTVDVLGHTVGLIHGHQTGGGAGIDGKFSNWFAKQAATRDPIGSSDILFAGHYHHLRYQQLIGKTVLIMGGAMCDESSHFAQTLGLTGQPVLVMGTITEEGLENFNPVFYPANGVE